MKSLAAFLFTFGLVLGLGQIAEASACQEDQPCWDCSSMGNHICGEGK